MLLPACGTGVQRAVLLNFLFRAVGMVYSFQTWTKHVSNQLETRETDISQNLGVEHMNKKIRKKLFYAKRTVAIKIDCSH